MTPNESVCVPCPTFTLRFNKNCVVEKVITEQTVVSMRFESNFFTVIIITKQCYFIQIRKEVKLNITLEKVSYFCMNE